MKRLFAAGAIALCLHLFLLTVRLPIPKSSARETNGLKAINIRVFRSAPLESARERPLDEAKKDDAYMIPLRDPVVEEHEIKQKEIVPHRKSISKKNIERKLSGARIKAPVPEKESAAGTIPPPPIVSVTSPDMVGDKGKSHEKLISKDSSLEKAEPEGSPQPLARAQPQSAPVGSEEPLVEASPDYLLSPAPVYPLLARKRGYEGKVVLDVLVDEKGLPAEIKIAESSGHLILDKAAKGAIASWKFQPARRGSITLPMRVKVPVLFTLD